MQFYIVIIVVAFVGQILLSWNSLKKADGTDRSAAFFGMAILSVLWPIGLPYLVLRAILEMSDTAEEDEE